MNNKLTLISIILVFALIGFVMAAGNGPVLVEAGNGSVNLNNALQGNGSATAEPVRAGFEKGSAFGEGVRVMARSGEYISEMGQMISVQRRAENSFQIREGNMSAGCDCNLTQERVQNKTKLRVSLSNGRNAEIKVMPNVASETALAKLRLKVCNESNGCNIELKEVGKGDGVKLAYELETERPAKILGLFRAKMDVKSRVDAETGELLGTDKPWWAFLASEPAE